jgi:hypothetical protein
MSEELGPLPPTTWVDVPHFTYTDAAMLAYAAQERAAERERVAKFLDDQKYMTLQPLRTYTADEVWQTVRASVKHLSAAIRALK